MDQKFDYRLNTSEEYHSLIVLGLRLAAFKNSGASAVFCMELTSQLLWNDAACHFPIMPLRLFPWVRTS